MDVVVVILTVNWLYYLNCESIGFNSSICPWFIQEMSSVQTVSSYGWCDSIPCVNPVFSVFG